MRGILQDGDRTLGAIDYLPAYGLSALRAESPPVIGFEPASAASRGLRVSIPEIEYSASFGKGAPADAGALPAAAMEAMLSTIHRPLSLLLRWECGGASGSLPFSVLPPWSWALLPETRLHLATFVLPDDGLATAAAGMDVDGSDVGRTCAALYARLRARGNIRYESPRVQEEPWSGTAHQAIRPAADILATTSPRDVGANCIDLSILFAGALEACGMNPLLILTGDRNAPPEHCLVGAWMVSALRFRPLIHDRDALVARLDAGDLLIWESTGVCNGHDLDFATAVQRGGATLRQRASVQAIDVSAARPPVGRCAPLFVANAPVVARAFLEAQRLADELGSKRREVAHLLYGACVAGGELTLWLLQRVGASPDTMATLIRERLPRERLTGAAVPTRNFLTCVSSARGNARHRGAASVDEADLLWALLENPSETVRQLVEAAGFRLSQLQRELGARADRPGEATTRSVRTADAVSAKSIRSGEARP